MSARVKKATRVSRVLTVGEVEQLMSPIIYRIMSLERAVFLKRGPFWLRWFVRLRSLGRKPPPPISLPADGR